MVGSILAHRAMACSVDSDCSLSGSWCEAAAFCNTQYGTCAVVSPCRNAPWLACDATSELCIASPLYPTPPGPSIEPTVGMTVFYVIVSAVTLLVIFVVCGVCLFGGLTAHAHPRRRRVVGYRGIPEDAETTVDVETLPKDAAALLLYGNPPTTQGESVKL